jgi:hypothetical protein
MSTDQQHPDDDGIESLLREVGARDEPSAGLAQEVRSAVHADWRAMLDERSRRRRFVGFGIAASVAAVAIAVAVTARLTPATPVQMASLARIDGNLEVSDSGGASWRDAKAGEHLATGETLRTDPGSRAALDLGGGISVRLDGGSLVELASVGHIALARGTLYVDADPARARDTQLVIATAAGEVRHLGTQYLVRTTDGGGIEVSVREGRIEVTHGDQHRNADAGVALAIAADGTTSTTHVDAHDARWHFAQVVAPTFDIDQQSLATFLAWVARETGRKIVFADARAEAAAAKFVLRGSVAGLDPDTALDAVLQTTTLKRIPANDMQAKDDSIGIALADAIDAPAETRPTP